MKPVLMFNLPRSTSVKLDQLPPEMFINLFILAVVLGGPRQSFYNSSAK